MADNYIRKETEKGDICINEEVLSDIVLAAAREIDGVAGLSNAVSEKLGIKSARGIRVAPQDGKCAMDIEIMVRYGANVQAVAKKVQDAVTEAVEGMTGLETITNVHVTGIAFERADMKG